MPNLTQSANRYFCTEGIVPTGQDICLKPRHADQSGNWLARKVRFNTGFLAGELDLDLVA